MNASKTRLVPAHISLSILLIGLFFPSGPARGQAEETVRLSEQTIYVPYEKLEEIFEDEGRGVFLPYKEFIELWTQLTPALPREPKEKPPVEGILVAAEYSGKVEGKVAIIDAHLEFRALKEGFSSVPLGAEGLSISEAKVISSTEEGANQAFLAMVDGVTAILPGPGTYHFSLRLMVPVSEQPGRKEIRFTGPPTAVSRFQLEIPEKDIEFTLRPAAAFTQETTSQGGTLLSAFFGSARTVEVSWSPTRVDIEQSAVLFADVDQNITFSEGSTRCDASVNVQILLAKLDTVAFSLPSSAQVLSVITPNLKAWDAKTEGDRQMVTVYLHSPAEGKLHLSVSYELATADPEGERDAPDLLVETVRRQSGNLSVFSTKTLDIRPARAEGVSQEALPTDQRGPRPLFVFRYLKTPYRLSFLVSRTSPRIEAEVHSLVQVGVEKWVVHSRADYQVKKAGVFQLVLLCPEGLGEPEVVGGQEIVEDYRTVDIEGQRRLEIDLKNKIEGPVSILVRAERTWESPDTETAVAQVIPFFQPLGADRVEGYLGVSVHSSLAANTEDPGTMRPEDIGNLPGLPNHDPTQPTSLTLGFRYRADPTPPTVSFKRRKSRVSAEILTLAEIREAFLRVTTTLAYQIDYAGVDQFSFQVPASIADEINITGIAIKEKTKAVAEEIATWTVTLQNKHLGRYELKVEHETPYERLAATAAETAETETRIPPIVPLDVFRETGYIAVLKDGNLEVTTTTEGLEAIDNKELPASLQKPGIFLAYKYDRGAESEEARWDLLLSIVRHAYVEVPASVVQTAVVRTVLTEEGFQTCQVTYYVQNKRAQYLELELPAGARILSDILVGDTPERPSRRESDGKLLIRLSGPEDPNQAIPVRLVYDLVEEGKEIGIWGKTKILPPKLGQTKILQTWWMLYLPKKYDYPKFGGPMREPLPGDHGWHRWRRYFDWSIPQLGIQPPNPQQISGQLPQDPTTPAAAGLKATFVAEGKKFTLHRLAEPATVTVYYRKRAVTVAIEILAFALAVVLGVVLVAKGVIGRVLYCVIAGVGAVILSVLVAPRAAVPYQCFYLGVFILGVVWAVRAWYQRPRKPKPPRPEKLKPEPVTPAPETETKTEEKQPSAEEKPKAAEGEEGNSDV